MSNMRRSTSHQLWLPLAALLALSLAAFIPAVHAQDAPLDFEESGDAYPDGTVMVTVVTTDDSTIDSVTWTQTYGVEAALSGADTATVTAVLGSESAYKGMLFHVLEEPPITEEQLPPNVPVPEGEFLGGLQNRFEVVGINPFALEETAWSRSSRRGHQLGLLPGDRRIHTHLPWKLATGIRNVPIGIPVLLHGKTQDTYDWALTAAAGSTATLMDATGQNPEFTPDVAGMYTITVTDAAADATTTLGDLRRHLARRDRRSGRSGQPDGQLDVHRLPRCSRWQSGPRPATPRSSPTSSTPATHYGEGCFACHTVGFDPDVDNGGIDEASDYQAFLDSGLINTPGDNWTQVLADYPETAQLANIQCENCHGPQNSAAHMQGVRGSISSNVCATCHGEPLRHARFQQWQLSAHANYEVAIDESQSGTCSRCHTGNGFLAWLPVLTGAEAGDPYDDIEVTWTEDEAHPQTCATCHDPHDAGDVSGNDNNATVRIAGDTPPLMAGFTATDVGRGAICMTCHNTRRGLRNDSNFDEIYRRPRPRVRPTAAPSPTC